jgi:hypothetical protein
MSATYELSEFRDQPTRRKHVPVLFREEPVVPREFTAVGMPVGPQRRPALRGRRWDLFAQLANGPYLRALILRWHYEWCAVALCDGYYESYQLRLP